MSGKGKTMRLFAALALAGSALIAPLAYAQDDSSEIIVTASRRADKLPSVMTQLPYLDRRPVIGLKRQADAAVRQIEIVSDSRDSDMRKQEVEAMLLAALDRAKKEGLSLVVGQYEVTEVTRENWRTQFPALAKKDDSEEEDEDDSDDDEDSDNSAKPKPGFEDDGSNATVRLMVKTRLEGTIDAAQKKITSFVKAVPATGRSLISQKGQMALTIVNPEQYRDEIYRRIAEATKHAAGFYGEGYGASVTGLDREIAWVQVSNTQVFLYIPYGFTVGK